MNPRLVGTSVYGLRTPIFHEGDDLVQRIPAILERFWQAQGISVGSKDVLAITESVVARTQGNYASLDAVSQDLDARFPQDTLGLVFPILSRNRFALILRAAAQAHFKRLVLLLSYPADEVGNHLLPLEALDEAGVDPWRDVLSLEEYRTRFGKRLHPFTGVDYINYYKNIVAEAGKDCEIIFANRPEAILSATTQVLSCDIHSRARSKRILREKGAYVLGLDEILTEPVNGSGYNPQYGLLGSNKASEETLKLFPRDCQPLVEAIQAEVLRCTGHRIEVMVYGDGAFKDPVGHIWELADPVVSPGFTSGLGGKPNELKLKYLADGEFASLRGKELEEALRERVAGKSNEDIGSMETEGTTPRRVTDLLGSLCDLTSGSGDKGTPFVYIQGYFDDIAH